MSTYSDTVEFQNDWTDTITDVWVSYVSGSEDPVYLQLTDQNIQVGDTVSFPGTISPRRGHRDYWTINFMGADNNLYGTEQGKRLDLPNEDGNVQIEIESNGNVDFQMPKSESGTIPYTQVG